ncbi:hypothetical protein I6N95_25770 [Vagococcus sp. BWB3-3]|uniref:Uncharacterized protein n=1 Tax=Vagococcus allomyrinae TaxID=2794353 RepID=A0A940PIX2_9ENTE|nr:hypothetical protein [Vagococcus allomyrinae]MBP1044421.1 hypothetical protein [Vagococcus allomyrinae]
MFISLSKEQEEKLKFELISKSTRKKMTRLIRGDVKSEDMNQLLYNLNKRINIARNVTNKPKYVLEVDTNGFFEPTEIMWHQSEIELMMHDCNSIQFIEIIADFLQEGLISSDKVNAILKEDGYIFYYEITNDCLSIKIDELDNIDISEAEVIPNISTLIKRMDLAFSEADYTSVLHTSATIYETLAKDVCNNPKVEKETLGSFFGCYKKNSVLPEPILDYILDVYKRRNTEPTAGHGSLESPTVTQIEASVLKNLTRAILLIEQECKVAKLYNK